MSTILVSGLPGVGKSTVLERIRTSRSEIVVLSVGELIREKAATGGVDGDVRTRLTSVVTVAVVEAAKRSVVERAAQAAGDVILLDSHTSTVGEFSVRLTPDTRGYLEQIDLTGVVMLRAPVETIQARRQHDGVNKRLGTDTDLEVLEMLMTSSLAALVTDIEVPMHVVDASGDIDDVTVRVLAAVDDILAWRTR